MNEPDEDSAAHLDVTLQDEGAVLALTVDGFGRFPLIYVDAGAMENDALLLPECIEVAKAHLKRCGVLPDTSPPPPEES